MTEKTLTTENIKPALDALRGELAPWPVVAKKQDRLNTAQLNAANSGITSSLVAQIIANTAAIRALESAITGTGLRALVVSSLPAIGTQGILYIVPVTTYDPETDADVVNYSNEYIWIPVEGGTASEGHYEQVGQTGIVINNGQLTITVNGTSVGTFTANQSGDTTAAITVPTNADYVDLSTNQTVAGVKTFSSTINGTASKAIADEDGTSIKTGYVNVAGNQTVTGQKTWTASNTYKANNAIVIQNNYVSSGSEPSAYQKQQLEWSGADGNEIARIRYVNQLTSAGNFANGLELSTTDKFKDGVRDSTGSVISTVFRIGLWNDGTKYVYNEGRWRANMLPFANNSWDLGSSSYQWSSVYAQSYYYNGTAWGLDKANVWTGDNTYTKYQNIIIAGTEIGVAPTNQNRNGLLFKDKNNETLGWVRSAYDPSGDLSIEMLVSNKYSNGALDPNGTQIYQGMKQTLTASGDSYFGWSGKVNNHVVPRTNNSFDLGTSTNQWSSVYAQSYYYNGVAWGLDQANVWSKLQTFKGEYLGREYTINYCTCFGICGNNDTPSKSGMFFTRYRPNKTQGSLGSSDIVQYGVDVLENEVNTTNVFDIRVGGYDSNTGKFTKTEVISTLTDANLGTSTYKWKTINGYEPSALGEVLVDNEVTIDTTNWVLDGSAWNTLNTSIMSGWVYLAVTDCDADSFILFRRGANKAKNPTICFHPQHANSGIYYLYGLFMVPKNTSCIIAIKTGTNGVLSQALLYPCFGNV